MSNKAEEKDWRLLSQISKNTITVNCECGSAKLKIFSEPVKIDYKCYRKIIK